MLSSIHRAPTPIAKRGLIDEHRYIDTTQPPLSTLNLEDYGPGLVSHHAELLRGSAIDPDVARARGYRSEGSKVGLKKLGFSPRQQRPLALVIPIHDVDGNVAIHQIRPDDPRVDAKGKGVKYDTPFGSKMVLDVHPAIRGAVREAEVPLFITEGCRKADAAISHGLCCISVLGVWNWAKDGEPYADWDRIPLEDREVFIAFDSDVMTKPSVEKALSALETLLQSRGARVHRIHLEEGENGAKVGLDDYLVSGNTPRQLVALASRSRPLRGGVFNAPVDIPNDPAAWAWIAASTPKYVNYCPSHMGGADTGYGGTTSWYSPCGSPLCPKATCAPKSAQETFWACNNVFRAEERIWLWHGRPDSRMYQRVRSRARPERRNGEFIWIPRLDGTAFLYSNADLGGRDDPVSGVWLPALDALEHVRTTALALPGPMAGRASAGWDISATGESDRGGTIKSFGPVGSSENWKATVAEARRRFHEQHDVEVDELLGLPEQAWWLTPKWLDNLGATVNDMRSIRRELREDPDDRTDLAIESDGARDVTPSPCNRPELSRSPLRSLPSPISAGRDKEPHTQGLGVTNGSAA